MHSLIQFYRPNSRGFSLVEIMVAMVIGLLGMIVVLQVFSVFEGQKRNTMGGDDAQNVGVIAMNSMNHEISQAGYGINSPKLMGCPIITPMIALPSLAPIIINPQKGNPATVAGLGALINAIPADANTDSMLVIYGDSNNLAEGSLITGTGVSNYLIDGGAAASGVAAVGAGGRAFQDGDYVIADIGNRAAGCTPLEVTRVNGIHNLNVPVAQMQTGFVFNDVAAKIDNPTLYNLGPSPHILAYAVINGALSVCDYFGTTPQNCAIAPTAIATNGWTQLASGIVSMKVQCVSPAGVRIALIARNGQINPLPLVTTAANAPTWAGTSPIVTVGNALGAEADANVWGRYRYKTFETFIPIRNATWAGAKGC